MLLANMNTCEFLYFYAILISVVKIIKLLLLVLETTTILSTLGFVPFVICKRIDGKEKFNTLFNVMYLFNTY